VRDLALGLGRILQHTPVHAIGLNYSAHFRLSSEEAAHRVGHTLAPKEFWKDFLVNPGMRQTSIQAQRDDQYSGYQVFTVEPSMKIEHGLFLDINNHIESPERVPGSTWITEAIEKLWQPHLDRV
jgi:hypothetical protein